MLARRQITLGEQPLLAQAVIKRDHLHGCAQARSLLQQTQKQIKAQLAAAQAQAQQLKLKAQQQAQQEFWQAANAYLQHWAQLRAQQQQAVQHSVSHLVAQALTQLTATTADNDKINGLVQQLLASQTLDDPGVLKCHPQQLDCLHNVLQQRGIEHWQAKADRSLEPDQLVLEVAGGAFTLSWHNSVALLLAQPDANEQKAGVQGRQESSDSELYDTRF